MRGVVSLGLAVQQAGSTVVPSSSLLRRGGRWVNVGAGRMVLLRSHL